MSAFGAPFPWNRASFQGLGQVPLVLGPSSWGAGAFVPGMPAPPPDDVPEGAIVPANGGMLEKRDGVLLFHLDRETLEKIEKATGSRPPESVPTGIRWCNPTPPIAATLGGFLHGVR